MPPSTPPNTPGKQDLVHSEEYLKSLMSDQFRLSLKCATAFLIVLFGLPIANYFAPDFMAQRVWGFTLSWLLLGVVSIPGVWIISGYFIRTSIRLEDEEAAKVAAHKSGK